MKNKPSIAVLLVFCVWTVTAQAKGEDLCRNGYHVDDLNYMDKHQLTFAYTMNAIHVWDIHNKNENDAMLEQPEDEALMEAKGRCRAEAEMMRLVLKKKWKMKESEIKSMELLPR